jgi:putative membrane protein
MVMEISAADRDRISKAITAAEAASDGEIVAVTTPLSDSYHDVALHWALVPLFAVLAWAAWRPTALEWWYRFLFGGWQPDPSMGELLTLLLVFAALKFTIVLLILKWMPLRLALTPAATKHRRVRRRAVTIFKAAAERRTENRAGNLIDLSRGERRAEIDAAVAIT